MAPEELQNILDSHCIAYRSLFYSQESSLRVAAMLMEKGGHVNRKEPEGPKVMEAYKDTQIIFYQEGWYLYCTKLDGHDYAIDGEFADNFHGQWAPLTIKIINKVFSHKVLLKPIIIS